MATRIIGIDPGLRITGYGIVELDGQKLRYIDSGEIKPPASDMVERLGYIHEELLKVIRRFKPDSAAVEQVFVNINIASALKLGHARGAIIVACHGCGLPVEEYAPTMIKQCLTGGGRADKSQVQYMVRTLLSLRSSLSPDASDALAVAICHVHNSESSVLAQASRQP